jgi:hypothetical protein
LYAHITEATSPSLTAASKTCSARAFISSAITSPKSPATAASKEAATVVPDGSAVAFADELCTYGTPDGAFGSPNSAGSTQSFCPTPTGPLVTRSVGIPSSAMPVMWRPP